jgi:NAD-dependent SIR2 family protein deacetylase
MGEFNADLIDDLARQRVVLFLGAGVSASATTRSGGKIKGWEAFLIEMNGNAPAGIRSQVSRLLKQKDFLLACEILQTALADTWEREVVQEFGQAAEPSPLHEAIVALDQRIIVTTNFDKLLEMSWQSKIGFSTHFPQVITSIDANIFNLLKDHSGKYLIKLHGTIDDVTSLVFSRSEYIRMNG